MARDIIITAGIKFDPKDIDTKAIRDAVVKSIANTTVNIGKITIGSTARTALQDAISKVAFRISKARFDSTGVSSLKDSFDRIGFVINKVRFSGFAINSLKNQFGNTEFVLAKIRLGATATRQVSAQIQAGAGAGAGAGGAAGATVAARASQTATERFRAQNLALLEVLNSTSKGERATRNYAQALLQGAGSAETFGAKIGQITTRFSAYLVSLSAVFAVQRAFANSLKFIFEFDSALQDVQKILRTTPDELQNLSRSLFGIANATAKSVGNATASFNEFIRAGIDTEESLKRTEAALIAVNVTGLSVEESTKLITSALTIFKDELTDGVKVIDLLTIADEKAAASSAEISRALLRAGGAGEAVGVTFKQLNAIIAATIEATQLSGSTIGAALKTIFANIAGTSDRLREQANAFGANIKAGDDVFTILQKLSVIFPKLNKEQVAVINQTIAGKRRFTELSGLLGNFGKVNEILVAQNTATGVSLQRNQVELNKLSAQAQLTANTFAQLVAEITGVGRGVEGVGSIRDGLASILGLVRSVGEGFLFVVGQIKELDSGLFSADSIIKALAKAAFFTIAPKVILGILKGLKDFFTFTTAVKADLNQIVKIQQQYNQVVSNTTIPLEKASLSIQQQRLKTLLEMKQIAGQIGTEKIAAGLGAIKIPPISQQGLLSGLLSKIGGNFGAQLLTVMGIQVIGDATAKLAKELEENGQQAGSILAKSISTFASLFTSLTFVIGPFGAAIVAVTKATFDYVKGLFDQNTAIEKARKSLDSLIAANATLEDAERLFGELGVQAFKEIAQSGADASKQIVSLAALINKISEIQKSSAVTLSTRFDRASFALDEMIGSVANLDAQLKFSAELAKAQQEIAAKGTELAFNIELGPAPREISDLRKSLVEMNVQLDRFKSTGDEAIESFSKLDRVLEANRERLDGSNKKSFDILTNKDNSLITARVEELLRSYTQELSILEKIKEENDAIISPIERVISGLNERLKILDETLKTNKEQNKGAGEDEDVSIKLRLIEKERAVIATKIADENSKIATLRGVEVDFAAKLNDKLVAIEGVSKEELDNIQNIVIELGKQVGLAGLVAIQVRASTKEINLQTEAIAKQAEIQTEIAQLSLKTGAVNQQQINREIILRKEAEKEIVKAQNEQTKLVENLRALERDANKEGRADRVKAIQEAITDLEEAGRKQIAALRQKIELEVGVQLVAGNIEFIKRAEESLLNFRLNAIDQAIRREQKISEERINLIEQFSKSIAGRRILFEQGFRPSQQAEKTFGTGTALILGELEKQTGIAIEGMLAKIQQLKVGGIASFEDLRKAQVEQAQAAQRLKELTEKGVSTAKIDEAQRKLSEATEKVNKLGERAKDSIEILTASQDAAFDAIEKIEEERNKKREIILRALEDKTQAVNEAEQKLIAARNEIPALNAKVIDAERNLASANANVTNATNNLFKAYQELANAQFKLNAEIAIAEFKARQATGGFRGASDQIGFLRGKFDELTSTIRASSNTILEIRRQIIQEEISLLQNQFQTVRSLAVEAATGGPEVAAQIAQRIGAAQAIARGAPVAQFPPELTQGIESLFGVIDGLEQAITSQGLAAIGLPLSTLQEIGGNITELSKSAADTGKSQVDQAVEQVRLTQEALIKAEEQKVIAQQELETARGIRDASVRNANIIAQNVAAVRAGFNASVNVAIRELAKLESLTAINAQANELLAQIQKIQNESLNEIILTRQAAEKQVTALAVLASRIAALARNNPTVVPTTASGSLTRSEFAGLLMAARKEKSMMPAGSRLMMANTSEVVLNRKQAKQIGLTPRPLPFAQGGNADATALTAATNALSTVANTLLNKLNSPGFVQQNIQVQLDQQRRLDVTGLEGIDQAVRTAFEERMATSATKEEQQAMSEIIQSIISRLNEQGIVNTQGF